MRIIENLSSKLIQKKKRPIQVLQFGEGNFLRAFVEWILQKANDEGLLNTGVVVVQPLEVGRVKELEEQDGLYTLYLQGIQQGEVVSQKSVIDVLDDFINPYSEYDRYLEYAKSEELRFVISNTTEAGIILNPVDIHFDQCPKTFPGKLLSFLLKRYEYFNGSYEKGLIIMPCELIDHNGTELKRVLNLLAGVKGVDASFIQWLNEANTFCDTLVDRIVPGYPKNEVEKLTQENGYMDHSMIKGEIFHLWVIQGDEAVKKEFPVDQAGLNVLFVKDLTPYKERKVRILNGSHTALVPVAYLYGIDTVREAVEDPEVGAFLKSLMDDEIVPTLDLPKEELEQFAADVMERFKNPFISHELISIALNSTTKYKTRNLSSVIQYIERTGKLPRKLLFSLAALLVFYQGKRGSEKIPLQDNPEFLDLYKDLWAQFDGTYKSVQEIVTTFLGLLEHWEVDLLAIPGYSEFVSQSVYSIVTKGMKTALKEVMG